MTPAATRHTALLLLTFSFAGPATVGCSSTDPQPPATAADVGGEGTAATAASDPHSGHDQHDGQPQVTRELADGAQLFGSEMDESQPTTQLGDLIADPGQFAGQVVKTEGVVAQVCQRMGCWMELRGEAGGDAVRVPMAGHSFFLPRDAAGKRAVVQGRLSVEALDEATQEHLREEGAQAAGQAISIEATSVLLR